MSGLYFPQLSRLELLLYFLKIRKHLIRMFQSGDPPTHFESLPLTRYPRIVRVRSRQTIHDFLACFSSPSLRGCAQRASSELSVHPTSSSFDDLSSVQLCLGLRSLLLVCQASFFISFFFAQKTFPPAVGRPMRYLCRRAPLCE